ncbi:MAG: Hpt domain-containing protein [Dehalococcoidia bacterium]|nr:Hpt domain-containing protein [Dehalococcoidia bacterium]
MTAPRDEVTQRLRNLRAQYLRDLPERVAELERLWREEKHSPGSWAPFRLAVHRLAGSGALFGCSRISETAYALDRRLDAVEAERWSPAAIEQLHSLYTALIHACVSYYPADTSAS